MSRNRFVNKKNTFVLASAVCAAGFGLIGCGDDSNSGTGPNNAQGDVCTVGKNGNTLTVKNDVNGVVTTTIYEFGEDGNMVSQSTVTDVGAGGETACNAMNVEGVSEASFEGGKCTVKTTAGLMPGSIDQVEQAQQMACDAANSAAKPTSNSSGTSGSSGKSGSSQGGADDGLCSVTKNASTIKTTTNIQGEKSTAVYVFDSDGALISLVTTSDLSYLGDDATAEAVCKIAGSSANYEKGGKCTVTENVGFGGLMTLEETYEGLMESCEAMKAATNSASSGDEGGEGGEGDSGSSTGKSSASAGPKEKVVAFEEGIMYTSSYGDRVRTFFNTVDEYSFFDDNAETKDSSGWWFSFDDSADKGSSRVFLQYDMGYVDAEIDLVYKNWSRVSSGTSYYMAPSPYPYGAIGFNMSPNGQSVDMSDWEGMCVTYSSSKAMAFTLKSFADGKSSWYTLLTSGTMKTVNLKFSTTTFGQPDWAIEQGISYPTFQGALQSVLAIHFKYSNDEAGVSCGFENPTYCPDESFNSIKIYKIGKYGACGS